MLGARKQNVTQSEGIQKRALLAHPSEHHIPIRTEYHAREIEPEFKWTKDSMLDFDRDHRAKRDSARVREGAALQSERAKVVITIIIEPSPISFTCCRCPTRSRTFLQYRY